jgi:DEAD/DEAH box helicase domain-containing protein
MKNSDKIIEFIDHRFQNQISSKINLSSEKGKIEPFPAGLDDALKQILIDSKIKGLYSHQLEAFNSISSNHDTLLISRTASGKTLSFLLPIINEYKKSENKFSTLLLYPTKALSRDQESTLGKLLANIKTNGYGTFDGDTPRDERDNLVRSADFIISNPDMLHSGILPNNNRKWKSFLSRLRYIIIDEVHSYRGVFGSHVSNVFRRLLRACSLHGSNPIFIASSATIGNPNEHVKELFGRDFIIIDKDASPRGEKSIYFINPPMVKGNNESSFRKGTSSVSIPLIREATEKGLRTICFCRARQEVERLYQNIIADHHNLKSKIKPYRGGLLPNERRQLEKDLFEGNINTIITTNALELGIDIGDMNLCILSGHPGTISSFWQQAGRVGRKGNESIIVFIAKDSPIDQYIIHHPEFVLDTPSEQAWLSADNPYILLQHLPCAAYENPLQKNEEFYKGKVYSLALNTLLQDSTIKPYQDYFRYALDEYPAKGVNLRGMTDYNIDIIWDGNVIGEIDPIGAMGSLHKDAIYQHLGIKYMSVDLDLEKKIATVDRVQLDYYTEAVWESMVEMIEEESSKDDLNTFFRFGYIKVSKQPKMYKKIKEKSYENVGYGPITLPPFSYETSGFCMFLPEQWVNSIKQLDSRYPDSALYGLSYILKHTSPSVCMGDTSDIHTDVAISDHPKNLWKSALYLYDSHEGGVGYSEKIFNFINNSFQLAFDVLQECECESGCPSCIPPVIPNITNKEIEDLFIESNASVECTKSLLIYLLKGIYEEPKIKFRETLIDSKEIRLIDPEEERLKLKLKKSAEILKNKRNRIH